MFGTYSAGLNGVLTTCLACAARARANRLITVLFVGVIVARDAPANNGLLRPATPPTVPVHTVVFPVVGIAPVKSPVCGHAANGGDPLDTTTKKNKQQKHILKKIQQKTFPFSWKIL